MSKFIDLSGQRFGRLTAVQRVENSKNKAARWLCKCDCGNETVVAANDLKCERVKSCGCIRRELSAERNTKHGLHGNRLYQVWLTMKARCYNVNTKKYKNYGARGITVCADWLNDFKAFYDWAMQNGYKKGLTIDRIDTNGNYEPLNCRWITQKEQQNNRRNNRYITYNGETHTIAEWAKLKNIKYSTLYNRICVKNWNIAEALN